MRPIEDYAFVGDTHSGGLISTEGSIDWLCLPRFDSPSCFAAILDPDLGGHWRIAPATEPTSVSRRYLGETLILQTTFTTDSGVVRLTDFLPVEEGGGSPRDARPHEVIARVAECTDGHVEMTCDYRPRFDYGSIVPWFRPHDGAIEAVGGPDALDLVANVDLEADAEGVKSTFTLSAGETASFIASYHLSHIEVPPRSPETCHEFLEHTRSFWETWASRCRYTGRWRDEVVRSLLTLKALTFAPTGGVVAAPTTSLPEQIGGPRNWDYRYCWLRDATFTLDALLDEGYTDEAEEWRDWLLRSVAGDAEDMQIMYGVLGERRLPEIELSLAGYEGSKPVRIGNAAHDQFQLDVYGEVMDSFHSARRAGIDTPPHAWEMEKVIVDFVCENWHRPDEGIWEVRSGRKHFVHSKVMAWVAVDRGIKAIERFGKSGPLDRWIDVRQQIHDDVFAKGIDPQRGCFVRAYGEPELDASLLTLPFVGFVPATDPVMRNTIAAIKDELMVDGYVLRYRTERADDGLPPGEGSFLMCSFWLVDCLVLIGEMDEAEKMFESLRGIRNDVDLLAEQYDPRSRRLLGNFPQAFSHVAFVTSALALDSAGQTRSIHRGEP
ncbi:MAG: glycoside hydrolase family 15 protein [Actinobacteria bacterium]|nr:glycoside hydrolase family 15 protein [Actinomycetota bacterium]